MKSNKKGFTLIELLAVIVILAVIALIAMPIVLNLIEKARKGSAVDSAYGLRKSAQLYYSTGLIESPSGIPLTEFNCDGNECISNIKDSNGQFIKLDIDGTVPTSGKITVNPNGEIIYEDVVFNNKYECIIGQSGPITCDGNKKVYITHSSNISGWAQSKKVTLNYDKSCSNNEYSIDGGTTWTSYTNEFDITQNTQIKVKATCDGNVVEETFTINKIDTTEPVLNATPFSTSKTTNSITIVVNNVVEDGEIKGYAFSIDDGATYTNIQTSNVYTTPTNLTSGATYKVRVKVYNATYGTTGADNTKAVVESASQDVTINTLTKPIINITPTGYQKSKTAELDSTQLSEYQANNYTIEYSIDGTNFYPYTQAVPITSNGTITIKVSDGTNNQSHTENITEIDNAEDVPTVVYTLSDGSTYTSDTWTNSDVTVTITPNGTGAAIDKYQITYDGGTSYVDVIGNTLTIDSEGEKNVQIKAIDKLGNESVLTTVHKVKIDKTNPTVSYSVLAGKFNKYQTVVVTADDVNFNELCVWLYKEDQYIAEKSIVCSKDKEIIVELDSDGFWRIVSKVTDKATNIQAEADSYGNYFQQYIIDTIAPVITVDETQIVVEEDSITIPYTVDDASATVTCVYGTDTNYGNTGTIENGTCKISGLTSGTTYYYQITATDPATNSGSDSGSATPKNSSTAEPDESASGLLKIVYLDPTDLTKKCNKDNSVSTTGTKEGCMKWYAFAETTATYDLILDHNTTALVAWNSDNSNTEMKEVQDELDKLVSETNWSITPRLIEADEIAKITGADTSISWDSTTATTSNYFLFETLSTSAPSQYTGAYGWLYENTYRCTSYGCSVQDNNKYVYNTSGSTNYVYGYWTSTPVAGSTTNVWRVHRIGNLYNNNANNANYYGVRPVITISKSIIS